LERAILKYNALTLQKKKIYIYIYNALKLLYALFCFSTKNMFLKKLSAHWARSKQ